MQYTEVVKQQIREALYHRCSNCFEHAPTFVADTALHTGKPCHICLVCSVDPETILEWSEDELSRISDLAQEVQAAALAGEDF